MIDTVSYVYAVVGASASLSAPPDGLDDRPVALVRDGSLAALVSALDGARYSARELEALTATVDQLAPSAAAHDRIVTWASDRTATVPLPLFSVFLGNDRVQSMLRDRRAELTQALEAVGRGREYTLRIYRDDEVLSASLPDLDPEFAAKRAAVHAASPGQRYLMQRKLDGEQKTALRQVARDVATRTYNALRAFSIASVSEPAPRGAAPNEIPLVLNASFLVAHDAYDAFRAALTELIDQYGSRGLRFDFTGPWPAYHFVGAPQPGQEAGSAG